MDAQKVFDARSTHHEVTMSSVIHVSVSHMVYPVTEAVLRQVFELYGCGVTRMAVFQGNGWVEASVQLRSGHEAVCARDALHGRNIYDGCCNISIECTPMPSLCHASTLPAAPSLSTVPNATSTTSATAAAPMSSTATVDTPTTAWVKPFTGTVSTSAQKVFAGMPSSPTPSSNIEVVQPTAAPTPATSEVQSTLTALVMDTAVAPPLVADAVVATPQCQQKVQQRRVGQEQRRIIKWVSGVPIPRRRVRWTPRSKYRHSSPPRPPPRPPEQSCSGQVLAPKSLSWPSFQFVTSLRCNRELMLLGTRPWCRSAFSPGSITHHAFYWTMNLFGGSDSVLVTFGCSGSDLRGEEIGLSTLEKDRLTSNIKQCEVSVLMRDHSVMSLLELRPWPDPHQNQSSGSMVNGFPHYELWVFMLAPVCKGNQVGVSSTVSCWERNAFSPGSTFAKFENLYWWSGDQLEYLVSWSLFAHWNPGGKLQSSSAPFICTSWSFMIRDSGRNLAPNRLLYTAASVLFFAPMLFSVYFAISTGIVAHELHGKEEVSIAKILELSIPYLISRGIIFSWQDYTSSLVMHHQVKSTIDLECQRNVIMPQPTFQWDPGILKVVLILMTPKMGVTHGVIQFTGLGNMVLTWTSTTWEYTVPPKWLSEQNCAIILSNLLLHVFCSNFYHLVEKRFSVGVDNVTCLLSELNGRRAGARMLIPVLIPVDLSCIGYVQTFPTNFWRYGRHRKIIGDQEKRSAAHEFTETCIQLTLSDVPPFLPLLPEYWYCTMTEITRKDMESAAKFCCLVQSDDTYQDNPCLVNSSYPSCELTINIIAGFHGLAQEDKAEPLCYCEQVASYGQVEFILAVKVTHSPLETCYSKIWLSSVIISVHPYMPTVGTGLGISLAIYLRYRQWDPGIMKLVLMHPIRSCPSGLRRLRCRSWRHGRAIAWGQAMFRQGGNVTPVPHWAESSWALGHVYMG